MKFPRGNIRKDKNGDGEKEAGDKRGLDRARMRDSKFENIR